MSLAEEDALEIFNNLQLGSSSEKVRYDHALAKLLELDLVLLWPVAVYRDTECILQPKLLKSLEEVVIKREPSLIDTFLSKVLEFQVDKSAAVRKSVLDFCDESLAVRASVENVLHASECIFFLLGDDNVSVVKRCIRALLGVLQRTLAIAASSANHSDKDGQDLWKTVENAVKRVESFVKDGKVSTGVKLSASKFLEQGILLATADKVPCTPPLLEVAGELPMKDSIVTKQDALKLGNGMLMALICLLKDIKQSETHGPLAIACIRSASQMLQAKPQFAGKLVPVLLSFGQVEVYQKDGKVSSALDDCLRTFASSENRLALPWKRKVSDVLVQLGMEPLDMADSIAGVKRARETDADAEHPKSRREVLNEIDGTLNKYEEQIKELLLGYDAEGLFNFIQRIPSGILADMTLKGLHKMKTPKVSNHTDLITDRICNLMLTRLKEDQEEKCVFKAMPIKEYKDALEPVPMDEKQISYQRLQAIKRILSHTSLECRCMKSRLVARLATIFPRSDNAFQMIVNNVMKDYHGLGGHEIFCLLLTSLLAEVTNESSENIEGLLPGSRYETALEIILEGMYQNLPPSDKSMVYFLAEVPAISSDIMLPLLKRMIDDPAGWDNIALLVARDVIIDRPKNRNETLDLALQTCVSKNESIRIKAIRMCTNQLYGYEKLQPKMENAALQFLLHSKPQEDKEEADLDADRFTSLYCALCTKKSSLLRDIFNSYSSLDVAIQTTLVKKCPNIAAALGPGDTSLLNIIESPPEGSIPLAICFIESFSSSMPPRSLVDSSLACFEKCQDPGCIIPILPGLQKKEAIKLVPSLIQLPEDKLVIAIDKLCCVKFQEQADPVISPGEILAVLHMVDDKRLLKYAMFAINVCLGMTTQFTSEVLAASLSQLITRIPLPQLFMRTVLQSLSVAPKLKDFIVGILGQLASGQIWTNATQWRGWIMAAQQTSPESFPIILRLPPSILDQVLSTLQESIRDSLIEMGLSNAPIELSDGSLKVLSKYKL